MSEVVEALQISQTAASRNLGALDDAGLLRGRRDGAWILYSVNRQGLDGHSRELLSALASMLKSDATAQLDIQRLNRTKRSAH